MDDINEYYELERRKQSNKKEIDELSKKESVKRYLSLKEQNRLIRKRQQKLYKDIYYRIYDSCNHVFVYSELEFDKSRGTIRSCGCIKCGLNESVLKSHKDELSIQDQIMYDYLTSHELSGTKTNNFCDLDLARSIYSKIIDNNPGIDDETAIKYFEIALDNIRNIDVSDERKESRAKRLSLNPDFNKWNSKDIVKKVHM